MLPVDLITHSSLSDLEALLSGAMIATPRTRTRHGGARQHNTLTPMPPTVATGRPERWRMGAEEGIHPGEPSRRRVHGDAAAADVHGDAVAGMEDGCGWGGG